MDFQKYKDNPNLNQSKLKAWYDGKTFGEPSVAMMIGSYLDAQLTAPETVDELFLITDFFTKYKPVQIIPKLKQITNKIAQAKVIGISSRA